MFISLSQGAGGDDRVSTLIEKLPMLPALTGIDEDSDHFSQLQELYTHWEKIFTKVPHLL